MNRCVCLQVFGSALFTIKEFYLIELLLLELIIYAVITEDSVSPLSLN